MRCPEKASNENCLLRDANAMGRTSLTKKSTRIYVVTCVLSLSSLFINAEAVSQQNTETSCYTVNIAVGKVGYTGMNYSYNFFPATGTVDYIKQEPSKIYNSYLSTPSFVSVYQEEVESSDVYDGTLYDGSYGTLDYYCYDPSMFKSHTLMRKDNVYLKMDDGRIVDSSTVDVNDYWMISCSDKDACTLSSKSAYFFPRPGYVSRGDVMVFSYDAIMSAGSAHDIKPKPEIGLFVDSIKSTKIERNIVWIKGSSIYKDKVSSSTGTSHRVELSKFSCGGGVDTVSAEGSCEGTGIDWISVSVAADNKFGAAAYKEYECNSSSVSTVKAKISDLQFGKQIQFSTSAIPNSTREPIVVIAMSPGCCTLTIESFSANNSVVDPSAGQTVTFSGSMAETTGKSANWTVTLTDGGGAAWRTFSGSGKTIAVSWDGKESFGKIVDDGTYIATLEAWTDDGKCKKTAAAQVMVKSSCGDIRMSVNPETVRPANAGQDNLTKSVMGIGLSKPAPSSGCDIRLRIEPVEGTGGHDHIGNRNSHIGSLSSNFVLFVEGETDTSVEYTSGVVAGTEKILAELMDASGNVMSTRTISIDVKVPGLEPLSGGYTYNLTGNSGQTTTGSCYGHAIEHAGNHYGQLYTIGYVTSIALDYYVETNQKLGINDMSLMWGGLFDICGNWTPPHTLYYGHPVGLGVDIDPSAQDENSGNYVYVDQDKLNRIANLYHGTRAPEASIHYTFPPHE